MHYFFPDFYGSSTCLDAAATVQSEDVTAPWYGQEESFFIVDMKKSTARGIYKSPEEGKKTVD